MTGESELANLDELADEVQAAASAIAALDAAYDELRDWASKLPDRWAGAGWSTQQLDTAVGEVSAALTGLPAPRQVLERLQAIHAAVAQARALGETAGEVRAQGDLSGFHPADAPSADGSWIDPEGDRLARETDLELAIEKAYRMVVALAEVDGVKQRWVGLVQLREQLDQARLRDGLAVYPRAEVDAALERLARQPGVHVQGEANQQALTAADRAAAVRFGGAERHLLQIVEQARCPHCDQEMDAAEVEFCGCDGAEAARIQAELAAAQTTGEPAGGQLPDQSVPAPAARRTEPAVVTGELSPRPLSDNGWGADPSARIHFHDDGPVGQTIRSMGQDARMDVDGEPLGDVLGLLATDVVRGVRSAQEGLDALKTLQSRIPPGSRARAAIDQAVAAMDAPATPLPAVPAETPDYLRGLVEQLHAVPLVRRDPARELKPLLELVDDVVAGRVQGLRLVSKLEKLSGRRHESLGDCGKFEIDRAIATATQTVTDQLRAARAARMGTGDPR